jgi:hypothetical protein
VLGHGAGAKGVAQVLTAARAQGSSSGTPSEVVPRARGASRESPSCTDDGEVRRMPNQDLTGVVFRRLRHRDHLDAMLPQLADRQLHLLTLRKKTFSGERIGLLGGVAGAQRDCNCAISVVLMLLYCCICNIDCC